MADTNGSARPAGNILSDVAIHNYLKGLGTIALVGASAKEVRPSFFVLRYLLDKGYRVIPINPGLAGGEIVGQRVYASLRDVPEPIDTVDVFRAGDAVEAIVEEALALYPKPKLIWMQLGIVHEGAAAKARAAGLDVVMNRCPKIEYGRLSGEIGWTGVNRRIVSSRKPVLRRGAQSWGIRS